MPTSVIAAAITGGSSLVGGLLGKGKTSTQDTTSTTKQVLTPEQQQIMSLFSGQLTDRMNDPSAGTAPIRTAGRNSINANYAGAGEAIRRKMLSAGQGASGKFGRATMGAELSRIGGLSDYENKFSEFLLNRQDQSMNLAQQFLGNKFETTTTGSGTSTQPGNVAGGALGGGLNTAALLYALNGGLSGGGGGSGGSGSGYGTSYFEGG